jgi:hypothetical protein
MEFLLFSLVLNLNEWLISRALFNFEWPELDIILNKLFRELSPNESLGIKDSVGRVPSSLVLSSISNKSFFFCEGDIRGSGIISLIILNDFNLVIVPYSDTGVGST